MKVCLSIFWAPLNFLATQASHSLSALREGLSEETKMSYISKMGGCTRFVCLLFVFVLFLTILCNVSEMFVFFRISCVHFRQTTTHIFSFWWKLKTCLNKKIKNSTAQIFKVFRSVSFIKKNHLYSAKSIKNAPRRFTTRKF